MSWFRIIWDIFSLPFLLHYINILLSVKRKLNLGCDVGWYLEFKEKENTKELS